MSTTITVEHLARVEGHGGITVELDDSGIKQVRFDVFEGARLLEGLVRGRGYEDISQILSRICAICSVAHSLTSLKATENAFGVQPSPQTQVLRDLLYRGESIESHALHLFLLAVPDYLGYSSGIALAADKPDVVSMGLRLKKLGNTIQEIIGGRAVHPVNVVLGGFGKLPTTDQLIALRTMLLDASQDCQTVIDLIASLPPADFCNSDTVFAALDPGQEYGYYRGDSVAILSDGKRESFPASSYRSFTNEEAVPHSHAKHSKHNGRPFMVGSLARLTANLKLIDGRAREAVERFHLQLPSTNPMDNNKAQAVELIFDIERALATVDELLKNGIRDEVPVPITPRAGEGFGITEAPRGMLIHSYVYDEAGRIVSADVITPTALNAASIEDHMRCAVEQGPKSDRPALTRKLEMIVRAYDPCISCSVHVLDRRHAV